MGFISGSTATPKREVRSNPFILAGFGIYPSFQRRCRTGNMTRAPQMDARRTAIFPGTVMHTIFLFVRGVVFFINHHQPQVTKRQKQRRPSAHNQLRVALPNHSPDPTALGHGSPGMPLGRAHTKTFFNAGQETRRSRLSRAAAPRPVAPISGIQPPLPGILRSYPIPSRPSAASCHSPGCAALLEVAQLPSTDRHAPSPEGSGPIEDRVSRADCPPPATAHCFTRPLITEEVTPACPANSFSVNDSHRIHEARPAHGSGRLSFDPAQHPHAIDFPHRGRITQSPAHVFAKRNIAGIGVSV